MSKLVILGTGVFAEEIADVASDGDHQVVGFGENWDRAKVPGPLLGLPVHWIDDLKDAALGCELACAIGTTARKGFTDHCEELGLEFARVIHPTARLSRTSTIGAGTILSVGVIVAAHTALGRHVIANRGAMIGHHTRVGDHVTISPGANIGGRVRIGDRAYIGMGAVVLNDVSIGSGSTVGAGAVVTKDVPERVQVLGVPARVTKEDVEPR
jgi:sugar O-acyltransferase (sialic acid O-acetyltransferase NeuD family)